MDASKPLESSLPVLYGPDSRTVATGVGVISAPFVSIATPTKCPVCLCVVINKAALICTFTLC